MVTTVSGFQETGILQAISGYQGDIVDGKAIAILGGNGLQAYGDLNVGNGCFAYGTNGNQATSSNPTPSTLATAGVVARNENTMNWVDSYQGYSLKVPDGKPALVITAGRILVLGIGYRLNTAPTPVLVASIIPQVGDICWASNIDGSIATTLPTVTTFANFTLIPQFRVLQNSNLYQFNPQYATYQTLVKIGTY